VAFDARLAEKVRVLVAGEDAVAEIKMFGGLCFTSRGNMICGVVGDELMVRFAADDHQAALGEPHTRPMDFTGRPMRGFVFVAAAGWSRPATLKKWLGRAIAHARSLPAKKPKPRKPRPVSPGAARPRAR
jgi:TfoX/Sxy family transcriptional regulator of competence genes